MSNAEADNLDQLLLRVRRATGRRLTKSQLIRALLGLLVCDSTLLDQVLNNTPGP